MSLTEAQHEMRDNIGNKAYWERRWQDDPDSVCADLMALYTVTGRETQKIISDLVTEKMKKIDELDDIWTKNMQMLVDLVKEIQGEFRDEKFKRKQDTERIDKHERQIKALDHTMATISLEVKHIGLQTQDIPKRFNNIESRLDTVIDHIMKIDKSPAIHQKQDKGSKIADSLRMVPNYAWILIGLGIVAGLAFLLTGDASLIDRLGVSK